MAERNFKGKVNFVVDETPHEHRYQHLRQETRPTNQWDGRVMERLVEDVFFCEECLDYRRVAVCREVPKRGEFGWDEVPV